MDLSQSQQSDKMTPARNCPIPGQMELIDYGDTLLSLVMPIGPWEGVARCGATPRFPGQSQGYAVLFCVFCLGPAEEGEQALPGDR